MMSQSQSDSWSTECGASSSVVRFINQAMQESLNIILVLVGQSVIEAVPGLGKNGAEFMEVGFSQGRTGTRFTEIAVTVRPREMFEDGEDVDIEDLSLEVKAGDGCWTKVEESPVRRGKEKMMWRVKIVPCKEHLVRIGIKRDGCVEYFQYPEAVGPASTEQIANSHFRPRMPENISITQLGGDSVTVSWSPSECAESYELQYGNMTVSTELEVVPISGLENCTDYTLKIVALVGEKFSDEGEIDFSTCQVNYTDILDSMTTEKIDDLPCETIDKHCELSTQRLEDFTTTQRLEDFTTTQRLEDFTTTQRLEDFTTTQRLEDFTTTQRLEDFTTSDIGIVYEEDAEETGGNETLFEVKSEPKAQTGQLSSSYSLFHPLLTHMVGILIVLCLIC
eukprot:GFUD01009981.1.p1 GENE.GFUD01009981.1~~GFUD01009981.1.p1  ORF type:complete len:393 (+),score=100.14 GFUD01009981.1:275-1453(+)